MFNVSCVFFFGVDRQDDAGEKRNKNKTCCSFLQSNSMFCILRVYKQRDFFVWMKGMFFFIFSPGGASCEKKLASTVKCRSMYDFVRACVQ